MDMIDASRALFAKAKPFVLALLVCGITALVSYPLSRMVAPTNIAMLFLLGVVLVAAHVGRGPAVLAAFLSVAVFDVVFVPPQGSFAVDDIQYLITFVVMLAVALLIAALTTGLRQQAEETTQRERDTRGLYETARELAGAMSGVQIAAVIVEAVHRLLGIEAHLFLADEDDNLRPVLPVENGDQSTPATPAWVDRTILLTVYRCARPAGLEGASTASERVHYLPLCAPMRTRGVLVARGRLAAAQNAMLEALVSVCAVAVERLHFVEIAQRTDARMQSERLRHALLTAVSHDLRTPLTALVGLADTLLLPSIGLSESGRAAATAIRDQARRVANMVSNLLEMARLQAGQVKLRRAWQPLEEVLGASLRQLETELAGRNVSVNLPPALPPVSIDAVLMERVFVNLLENAAKYSPDGTPIGIEVIHQADELLIAVVNCGTGDTADADRGHLFELFERGIMEPSIPGAGLGLAICRTIIEAHGGHIRFAPITDSRVRIEFTLPCGNPPEFDPEAELQS